MSNPTPPLLHCAPLSCSVLLTECGTAKLTDLGLARCCAAAAAAEEGKAEPTSMVGTFAW